MKISFLLTALLLALISNVNAQKIHDFDSLYEEVPSFKKKMDETLISTDFFEEDAPVLSFILSSDLKKLTKNKDESKYQKAQIQLMINDTVLLNQKLKIKTRGALRKSICNYPPIKLDFPKKDMKIQSIQEFDKMKMVSNCKTGDRYEQYILSEYLTYKIYNLLTDFSFRVRLLNVTYEDTGGKYKTSTRYSFLIEPISQLAERMECLNVDLRQIPIKYMNAEQENIMAVFQYMIGNTDFSIPGFHNMKFVKSTDYSIKEPVAVPYDFDYTGFVNAPYAIPSDKLPIKKVTDRYFMGGCASEANLKKTFEHFKSKREEINALIENFDLLTPTNRKRHKSYMDQFYSIIESNYRVKNDFLSGCVK